VIKGLDHGGAERLLVDMAARGDREQFDYEAAYILARHDGLAVEMKSSGTEVHSLGAKADWDLAWMLRLRKLVTAKRYDVVHFHLPYPATLGRLVIRSIPFDARPQVVYTEHSQWGEVATSLRTLNRATERLDDALIVVSESSREALPDSIKHRAAVIVHGIDLSAAPELLQKQEQIRHEVRSELGVQPGEVIVLTVANLRIEKGYDVLLQAARNVLNEGLPARFVAVGHGLIEHELRMKHAELDLGDRFQFLGLRTDVLRLMTGSDVFALPSHFEGLPVTLMEATIVGMPIVATAVGEIPGIFTDGLNALVVPPGDPAAFADALRRVVGDEALRRRLGLGALECSKRFDVTTATRRVESIYRRLLDPET